MREAEREPSNPADDGLAGTGDPSPVHQGRSRAPGRSPGPGDPARQTIDLGDAGGAVGGGLPPGRHGGRRATDIPLPVGGVVLSRLAGQTNSPKPAEPEPAAGERAPFVAAGWSGEEATGAKASAVRSITSHRVPFLLLAVAVIGLITMSYLVRRSDPSNSAEADDAARLSSADTDRPPVPLATPTTEGQVFTEAGTSETLIAGSSSESEASGSEPDEDDPGSASTFTSTTAPTGSTATSNPTTTAPTPTTTSNSTTTSTPSTIPAGPTLTVATTATSSPSTDSSPSTATTDGSTTGPTVPTTPTTSEPTSTTLGRNLLDNGSFEVAGITNGSATTRVSPWRSSAGVLEIWASGHQGISSSSGSNHAELNVFGPTTYSQTAPTRSGVTYQWSLDHRGLADTDSLEVLIDGVTVETISTGTSWTRYRGSFVASGSSTEIALRSTDQGGSGNLIDLVRIREVFT